MKLGIPLCWDADPRWGQLPISNLPAGVRSVRRRIRQGSPARAYVQTESGLQVCLLAPDGPEHECRALKLVAFQGANVVPPPDPLAGSTGSPTGTEARVCVDITKRQAEGVAKYGVTVEANPLPLRQWLQHAYEETLDKAIYLRRAIEEIDQSLNASASATPEGGQHGS